MSCTLFIYLQSYGLFEVDICIFIFFYRLIVRNFWSDETRLPTNTLDRMLSLLRGLYSDKIETQYLSLATNFLLEMTSKSPDYSRKMFEYPLSECKFQVNVYYFAMYKRLLEYILKTKIL